MSKKLLRKKLALMLANLKKKRKYYCEVEYLESTGTQYINTGLLSTANSKVDCVFGFSSMESGAANNVGVFGGRNATTTNTFTLFKIASATPQYFRFDYNGQPQAATANQMAWNTTSKYRLEYMGAQIIVTNLTTGESVTTTRAPGSTFTSYPICLFAVNTAGTIGQYLSGRIYKYWYTDGTNTIDLIPVLDWDMTPCMYDKVSGQLFYNAGTGNFTAGREIHQVEYIETDGTSYINTGYTPSGSTETEITTMLKDQTTSRFMFGCRTAQSSSTYACLAHNSNRIGYRVGTGGYVYSNGYNELNTKHTYKIANGVFYRDDVVVNTACQGATTSPNSPLALLTINTNNVLDATQPFIGNFYSCTIKDNNTLVRDYIPAIDENGVGFMLDRVSHTIYDNAGTGAFKYPAREIEYLESTGTQYINTGYIASNTSGFSVRIMPLQASDKYFIGSRPRTVTNDRWLAGSNAGPQVYIGWNTNNFVNWELNKVHTVQNNFMNSRTKVLDGTIVAQISEALSLQGSRTTYLFSANDATAVSMDTCRIYKVQISEGSTLVRDFIPCYKDGVLGMWDKVNNVFYPNAGTGAFTTGKIVEPEYE